MFLLKGGLPAYVRGIDGDGEETLGSFLKVWSGGGVIVPGVVGIGHLKSAAAKHLETVVEVCS